MNPQGGNKMAEMPIRSLLLNMGAPMMSSRLGRRFTMLSIPFSFLTSQIRR